MTDTSPGIPGTYRQLARHALTTAWTAATRRIRRAAHNATARCTCWDCDR